jgi:hypothetical protein
VGHLVVEQALQVVDTEGPQASPHRRQRQLRIRRQRLRRVARLGSRFLDLGLHDGVDDGLDLGSRALVLGLVPLLGRLLVGAGALVRQPVRSVVDVLVEHGPRRVLVRRAQHGDRVVSLDRQLGDLLLHPHGHLHRPAHRGHRQFGEVLGEFSRPLDGGGGETGRDPDRQRQ